MNTTTPLYPLARTGLRDHGDLAAAARAAGSPVDAEAHEWVQAVSRPTPAMLAAAERLRQSINQRRAERQDAVT